MFDIHTYITEDPGRPGNVVLDTVQAKEGSMHDEAHEAMLVGLHRQQFQYAECDLVSTRTYVY